MPASSERGKTCLLFPPPRRRGPRRTAALCRGPGDDLGGGEAGGGGKGGRRELRHDRCRARLGLVSKRENPKTDRTTQHTAAADENFGQSKSGIQPFISSSFYKICPFLGAFAIRLSILLSSPSNLKFADIATSRRSLDCGGLRS